MNTKHTKWEYGVDEDSGEYFVEGRHGRIAEGLNNEEALLIVASPALFSSAALAQQALELACDVVENAGDEETRGIIRSALIELGAALTKATGARG